jgi:hypothetical protein
LYLAAPPSEVAVQQGLINALRGLRRVVDWQTEHVGGLTLPDHPLGLGSDQADDYRGVSVRLYAAPEYSGWYNCA